MNLAQLQAMHVCSYRMESAGYQYTIATYIHAYTPKLALVEDEDEIVDSAIKGKIKIFALIGESL